jgi:hypothetical protein
VSARPGETKLPWRRIGITGWRAARSQERSRIRGSSGVFSSRVSASDAKEPDVRENAGAAAWETKVTAGAGSEALCPLRRARKRVTSNRTRYHVMRTVLGAGLLPSRSVSPIRPNVSARMAHAGELSSNSAVSLSWFWRIQL